MATGDLIADSAFPDPKNPSRAVARIVRGGFGPLTARAFARPHNG